MDKKKLIMGGVAVILIAGGVFLFTGKSSKGGIKLETAKVGRSTITNTVTATGTVEPVTEVEVGTQVSGIIDKLYADYNDVVKAGQLIAEMDKILPPAREKVNAELGDRFAKLCQEHEFFYILGSGPNFSQTYGFAICSLMEMQWQHCSYIHSAEYFHGPFEATQDGVFYFLQMGSSECRAMDERALAFLKTHTDTLMVLDAKEYGMEAVPASVRAYLDPVLFYAMNCELRAARGKVFDHDPDFRRYMGVVEY